MELKSTPRKHTTFCSVKTQDYHLACPIIMARKMERWPNITAWRKERIRTPGTVSGSAVFKTAALDHSAILQRMVHKDKKLGNSQPCIP